MAGLHNSHIVDLLGSFIGKFVIYALTTSVVFIVLFYIVRQIGIGHDRILISGSGWIAFVGHVINFIYYYVSWEHIVVLPVLYILLGVTLFAALGLF
jgi:hypothetical protein